MGCTAPLTSKCCILYIYSTNIGTEYFKHALYSRFFPLQNAVCFIMLTCFVPVLFTFYTRCAKIKKYNSSSKGLVSLLQSVTNAKCIICQHNHPFFNAYHVVVHKPSDLLCIESFQLRSKTWLHHILNFIITGKSVSTQGYFSGLNMW